MTLLAKTFMASTLLALTTAGCSGAAENVNVKSKAVKMQSQPDNVISNTSSTGYSKPSAAIDFQHDFSGRSTLGSVETLNLKISDRYPGGTVEIIVNPTDGLEVFKNGNRQSFKMGSGANNMTLQFQPKSEGVHRLNFLAVVKTADGQSISKSYSIPVYVGDQFVPEKRVGKNIRDNVKAPKTSGGLVIMEAEETVTSSD